MNFAPLDIESLWENSKRDCWISDSCRKIIAIKKALEKPWQLSMRWARKIIRFYKTYNGKQPTLGAH